MRALLVVGVLLSGCQGNVGDRCQLPSDCAGALVCVYPMTWTCPSQFPDCPVTVPGGTCQQSAPDASAVIDLGEPEDGEGG
jgi:hypothetical protein